MVNISDNLEQMQDSKVGYGEVNFTEYPTADTRYYGGVHGHEEGDFTLASTWVIVYMVKLHITYNGSIHKFSPIPHKQHR